MVSLPKEFVATREYGYFWNVETKTLFSIKSGVLKELKKQRPNKWNHYVEGYAVSVNGYRYNMSVIVLNLLKPHNSKIPVKLEGGYNV